MGSGNDYLVGGAGSDFFDGGAGDDQLTGNGGIDILIGGDGNDRIWGGAGDTLAGGEGTDLLSLNLATQSSEGVTFRVAEQATETVLLPGDTSISGFEIIYLTLGQGNDTLDLRGSELALHKFGTPSTYTSYFNMGTGADTILIDATSRSTAGYVSVGGTDDLLDVDLSDLTTDTYIGDRGVSFEGFSVSLENSSGWSQGIGRIIGVGGSGNDDINGSSGDDILSGGAGDDEIKGGPGSDTVIFNGNRADYFVTGNGTTFTIVDSVNARDGTDRVSNVELITFANATYSVADLFNVAPTVNTDTFTVGEDAAAAVIGNALANDTDPDAGDTLTALVQTNVVGSNGGLFSIASNGDVTFAPGQDFQSLNAGETATTSFTYTAEDGNGGADTATITVTVEGADGATVILRSEDTRVGGTGTLTRYYGDSESGVENGRTFALTYEAGKLAAREIVYEDGRTLNSTYDANGKIASQTLTDGPGDTLSYQSSTTTYVDGVRSQVATLMDNGTTSITDYAANGATRAQTTMIDTSAGGGNHNYETLTITYHSDGKIASRVTVFDEGDRYTRTEYTYDEDGDPESQLFVYSDGRSRENIYTDGALDRIVDTSATGQQTIHGLAGDDVLTGTAENDRLLGGTDNDTLNGGEGDDLLVGGLGDDIFIFTGIVGNDTITDFDHAGDDLLDLTAFGVTSRDDLDAANAITQSGASVVIDLAAINDAYEGAITLSKTTLDSIGNDDFATIV